MNRKSLCCVNGNPSLRKRWTITTFMLLMAYFLPSFSYEDMKHEDLRQKIKDILTNDKIDVNQGNDMGIKKMGMEAIPILIDLMHQNRHASVLEPLQRDAVGCSYLVGSIYVLGELRVTKVADEILGIILDPQNNNDSLKRDALFALGKIGSRKHIHDIKRFANYKNPSEKDGGYSVRIESIDAIVKIGDEREIPFLEKVWKNHPDKFTRHFAEDSIKKIKQKKKKQK